jgi:hypothetical protein
VVDCDKAVKDNVVFGEGTLPSLAAEMMHSPGQTSVRFKKSRLVLPRVGAIRNYTIYQSLLYYLRNY